MEDVHYLQKGQDEEMKKYQKITKLSDNNFLNLYHLDAIDRKGKLFDYFFVSRRKENEIKIITKRNEAEGMVIYPVWKDNPDKIIMIRQYRYPLDAYIYELPAGLIEKGEKAEEAAKREMEEETGLKFEVYQGGEEAYRRAFFMGPGFTDESSQTVFGLASGNISDIQLEDTESIQVLLVDKTEAKRILKEEQVSLRCAYLLMHFIHSQKEKPFAFLKD